MPIRPIHKVYLGEPCFQYNISSFGQTSSPALIIHCAKLHTWLCCIMAEEGEGEAEAANPFQRRDKASQSVFGIYSEL